MAACHVCLFFHSLIHFPVHFLPSQRQVRAKHLQPQSVVIGLACPGQVCSISTQRSEQTSPCAICHIYPYTARHKMNVSLLWIWEYWWPYPASTQDLPVQESAYFVLARSGHGWQTCNNYHYCYALYLQDLETMKDTIKRLLAPPKGSAANSPTAPPPAAPAPPKRPPPPPPPSTVPISPLYHSISLR